MRRLFETHKLTLLVIGTISMSVVLIVLLTMLFDGVLAHIIVAIGGVLLGTAILNGVYRHARLSGEENLNRQFHLLNTINNRLANADTLDEIYRQAVTFAVNDLAFERFAIFLYDPIEKVFLGTYGVDTDGTLRNEGYFKRSVKEMDRVYTLIENGVRSKLWQGVPIYDNNKVVGVGWNANAILYEGTTVIGWVATDNFITHRDPPPYLLDLLTQYGILIGHHISRKRKEIQIGETEERFYKAFHANPAGIVVANLNTFQYVDVNAAFLKIFGYTREEVIGKSPDELNLYVNDDDRVYVLNKLRNRETIRGMELKGRRKDGNIIIGRNSIEVIEVDGEPHYLVMSEDVTEQKNTEAALQKAKDELEQRVLERTRDLKVAMDVSREIATVLDLDELLPKLVALTRESFDLYVVSIFIWSPQMQALTLRVASIRGQDKVEAQHLMFTNEQDYGMVLRAQKTGEMVLANNVTESPVYSPVDSLPQTRSEVTFPLMAGDHYLGVVDLQADKVNRFSPEDVRILKSLADIFSIAIQNAQLYAQQVNLAEELQAVDTMKSQFLASMSHELRTPLNAILNFTKFVSRGTLGEVTPKQVQALEKVIKSGQHLLSLINDILDISKIEADAMNLFIEVDVDLISELLVAVDTGRNLLLENNSDVKIVMDFDKDLPRMVGDKRRLRQVFLNLISNACKFTEKGTITIRLRYQDDHVVVAVIDTGTGIPIEEHEMIFSAFKQTKNGMRQREGTGLGLPISRRLVEAHHGEMWLESTVGKGSAFFVKLPLRSKELLAQLEKDTNVT